jgi:hypothetical protein
MANAKVIYTVGTAYGYQVPGSSDDFESSLVAKRAFCDRRVKQPEKPSLTVTVNEVEGVF